MGIMNLSPNSFSGERRLHQKMHMVCGIAHKQPQPKRIDVTRVMAKTRNNFGPPILPCVPESPLKKK